jgi:hypothetical protein
VYSTIKRSSYSERGSRLPGMWWPLALQLILVFILASVISLLLLLGVVQFEQSWQQNG